MFSNTNRKKFRVISRYIDMELIKIDKLLSRINREQVKTKRTAAGRNIRAQQEELSGGWAKNQQKDIVSQAGLIYEQESYQYEQESYQYEQESYQYEQESYQYEQESYQYQFRDVEIQRKEEQIVLDHQHDHQINQYVSRINVSRPLETRVQVKSNWVEKYLDHGDCQISLSSSQQTVEIIGVQNGVVSCMNQNNQFIKLQMAQTYKYDSLLVNFINHTQAIGLSTSINGKSQLYQLNIKSTTRFVARVDNHQRQMRRILIIKEDAEQEDVGYELLWGTYFKQQLTELVTLQSGKYIIISLGITALSTIELYFQSTDSIDIRVAEQESLKTRHILTKTFTSKYNDSYQPVSRDINPSYTRNVYMDIGMVVQTYQNIYQHETSFIDEEPHKEDIALLFKELYNPQQIENRLTPGEKIVKFYSIQQKPARLFIPRKCVLMGSKIMQTMKIHSVFK